MCAAINGLFLSDQYTFLVAHEVNPSLNNSQKSKKYLEVVKYLVIITRPSLATMQDALRIALQARSLLTALYLIVKIFYHHGN
jgi:hypothetical protein